MSVTHEEAARWFAALRRGVMAVDERSEYETWLAVTGNKSAMAEMEAVWSAMAGARVLPASAPRTKRKIMVAAACALTLGIGTLSYAGDAEFWTSLDWANR